MTGSPGGGYPGGSASHGGHAGSHASIDSSSGGSDDRARVESAGDRRLLPVSAWRRHGVHAEHGMSTVMPSPRSCRVMCAYQDVATIFCVLARHDPEVRKPWSSVRHKQEILSQEG